MSTRTRAAGILTAITMTALMAACSGTDSVSDSGTSEVASDGGADSAGSADAPDATSREFGGAAADTSAGSGAGSGSDSPAAPEMERSVIASATISLTSKDVAATRRDVQRIVDAQGGAVTEEKTETDDDADGDGDASYARLVIRVPSPAFDAAMAALEKAGELRSSTRGTEDVTTRVIDTGVRVRAQEASLKRVELLLAEARTLKDVIWIESQLTSRQAELDSLKSQQSWLKDQTSLSTITVDITHEVAAVEEEPKDEPAGFVTGLEGGMKALGASFAAVATIFGALLPFAAVALVLGLPVWLVVRRRRSTRTLPQSPAA